MKKLLNSYRVWNKRRHAKSRDRLWNKLSKDEQLELMMMKVNGQI